MLKEMVAVRRQWHAQALGLTLLIAGTVMPGNAQAPDTLRVYVLYSGSGKGDRAFNDVAYEGLLRARQTMNFSQFEIVPANSRDAAEILISLANTPQPRPEMLVTIGFEYTDALRARRCDLGGRLVLHMDDALPDCPNARSVTYRTYEPSFLAGVAAMAASPRKTAAAIGGMQLAPVEEFIRGFEAGVHYAGGRSLDARYLADSPAGFADAAGALQLARQLFEEADVIFGVAGGSNLGVFEAAKEGDGRYALGVDADQTYLGEQIIVGSVVKRLDRTIQEGIAQAATGTFQAGQITAGMAEGGTDFVVNPLFASVVGPAVEEARAAAFSR